MINENDENVKRGGEYFRRLIDDIVLEELRRYLQEKYLKRKLYNKPTRKFALRKKFSKSKEFISKNSI